MKFIGMILYMGVNKRPNLKMYWESSELDSKLSLKSAFISNLMSYQRFVLIRKSFRITNYIDESCKSINTVLLKTKEIINALNKMSSLVYTPN